jgi:threonine/homoserine/homoserine lactone efflux protein
VDFQIWLTFALASLVIAIIPGPGVASIIGFAISSSRNVALASVLGMAVGNMLAVSLSLAGAAAVLAASALAFSVLKWLGAGYLIGTGVLMIVRSRKAHLSLMGSSVFSSRRAFLTTLVVGTLHPKTILFFVAFSSQFIRPAAPYLPQAVILVLTFTLIAAATDTLYALTASRGAQLLTSEGANKWSQRAGGGVLVTAGLAMVAMPR